MDHASGIRCCNLQNLYIHLVLQIGICGVLNQAEALSVLSRSYRKTLCMSTSAPIAQSSGLVYSSGLCDTPFRHGTKIMLVGHRRLAYTLSWPAPLTISLTRSSLPVTDTAASRTAAMQSGWKSTAADVLSVCHSTPSLSFPEARDAKSFFSSASTVSTVLSAGARMSRLKRTWPGMVLTLPGDRVRMPVDAKAECFTATSWERVIRRAARSSASARAEKGVVPVWASVSQLANRTVEQQCTYRHYLCQ